MYGFDFRDDPKPQHIQKNKKRRGFPAHLARIIAQKVKPGEPHFVCESCKGTFKLTYLKIHSGSLVQDERNLCRDCYKIATQY